MEPTECLSGKKNTAVTPTMPFLVKIQVEKPVTAVRLSWRRRDGDLKDQEPRRDHGGGGLGGEEVKIDFGAGAGWVFVSREMVGGETGKWNSAFFPGWKSSSILRGAETDF